MEIQTIELDEATTLILEVESTASYEALNSAKEKQFAELWEWVDQQEHQGNAEK